MISERSRQAFDHMLIGSLGPVLGGNSTCHLETQDQVHLLPQTRLAAITLSSYLFRMMVLISFSDDAVTRKHVASNIRKLPNEITEKEFLDAISEMVNMGCGALSRSLSTAFPHIGLSTPNLLDRRCVDYLKLLKHGHLGQFTASVDTVPMFHVYSCVSEYDDLDFAYEPSIEVESTGELELF
jgi:hypothetical protein